MSSKRYWKKQVETMKKKTVRPLTDPVYDKMYQHIMQEISPSGTVADFSQVLWQMEHTADSDSQEEQFTRRKPWFVAAAVSLALLLSFGCISLGRLEQSFVLPALREEQQDVSEGGSSNLAVYSAYYAPFFGADSFSAYQQYEQSTAEPAGAPSHATSQNCETASLQATHFEVEGGTYCQ